MKRDGRIRVYVYNPSYLYIQDMRYRVKRGIRKYRTYTDM